MSVMVRGIDGAGDWTWGAGVNNYKTNNAAVSQNIQTRVLSFLNDCFFATQDGIDWFNLLGSKNQVALNFAVSAAIINTPYVSGLTQLSLVLDPSTRLITITYNATTSFGPTVSTINFAPSYLLTESGDIIETESGEGILT